MTTLAYRSDPKLRADMLAIVEAHEKADRIESGHYSRDESKPWTGGCAIGCTIETAIQCGVIPAGTNHGDHAALAALGVPKQIAHLIDHHFENMNRPERDAWPRQVLAAIQCGADLSGVWPKFAVRTLDRILARTPRSPLPDRVRESIERVRNLYAAGRWSAIEMVDARKAASAAAAATAYAAYAADAAGAADAAYAAAGAAAAAAERKTQRDDIIELLASAPTP